MPVVPVMSHKLDLMILMASLDTVDTNGVRLCAVTRQTVVEVVHWEGVITADRVETFTEPDGIL